jgi:hypothetical protein
LVAYDAAWSVPASATFKYMPPTGFGVSEHPVFASERRNLVDCVEKLSFGRLHAATLKYHYYLR